MPRSIMLSGHGRKIPTVVIAVSLATVSFVVMACQVPVFRYALERWEADRYTIRIQPGKSGTFSASGEAVVEFFRGKESSDDFPANIFVKVDADSPVEDSDDAMISLIYPEKVRGLPQRPIWRGEATPENAAAIIDSPIRREIVTRLLAGDSAVWVLLESGDKSLDGEAATTVKAAIARAGDELKIPEGVLTQTQFENGELPPDGGPLDPDNVLRSEVPLKVGFSMLKMRRDDPEEAVLLQMLVNLEDDLGDYSAEPMVFPVFGRGRILEPLIGRGISEANVLDYAGYLCGACSCEVKDLNPGMDLLTSTNWAAAIQGSEVIIEKILPPLVGTAALTDPAGTNGFISSGTTDSETRIGIDSAQVKFSGNPGPIFAETAVYSFSTWWLVVLGAFVFIFIATIVMIRKKSS